MRYLTTLTFLVFGLLQLQAQETKVYTSLEDALKNPELVYKLDLSHKGITELPAEIGLMTNLQELKLTDNKLTGLPVEITKLSNLKVLLLMKTDISALPEGIANLQNLKLLALMDTKISLDDKMKIKKLLPKCSVRF